MEGLRPPVLKKRYSKLSSIDQPMDRFPSGSFHGAQVSIPGLMPSGFLKWVFVEKLEYTFSKLEKMAKSRNLPKMANP